MRDEATIVDCLLNHTCNHSDLFFKIVRDLQGHKNVVLFMGDAIAIFHTTFRVACVRSATLSSRTVQSEVSKRSHRPHAHWAENYGGQTQLVARRLSQVRQQTGPNHLCSHLHGTVHTHAAYLADICLSKPVRPCVLVSTAVLEIPHGQDANSDLGSDCIILTPPPWVSKAHRDLD